MARRRTKSYGLIAHAVGKNLSSGRVETLRKKFFEGDITKEELEELAEFITKEKSEVPQRVEGRRLKPKKGETIKFVIFGVTMEVSKEEWEARNSHSSDEPFREI